MFSLVARRCARAAILSTRAFHSSIGRFATERQLLESQFWNKKLNHVAAVRDTNKDGVISLSDFELILKRYSEYAKPMPTQLQRARQLMTEYCGRIGLTDGSVELSYEELKRGTAKAAENPKQKDFYYGMFDMIDVDESKSISFDEWAVHHKCIGIFDPKWSRASFDAMDLNKDGVITEDEFVAYHYEFFFTDENKLNSAILFGPLD